MVHYYHLNECSFCALRQITFIICWFKMLWCVFCYCTGEEPYILSILKEYELMKDCPWLKNAYYMIAICILIIALLSIQSFTYVYLIPMIVAETMVTSFYLSLIIRKINQPARANVFLDFLTILMMLMAQCSQYFITVRCFIEFCRYEDEICNHSLWSDSVDFTSSYLTSIACTRTADSDSSPSLSDPPPPYSPPPSYEQICFF